MKIQSAAILIMVGALITLIVYVSMKDSRELQEFNIKCSDKGGMMYRIKGAKGMPKPLCLKPGTLIDIEGE